MITDPNEQPLLCKATGSAPTLYFAIPRSPLTCSHVFSMSTTRKDQKGRACRVVQNAPPHSLTKAVSSIQSNGDHRTFLHVAIFLNTSAIGWQNNARNEGYAAMNQGDPRRIQAKWHSNILTQMNQSFHSSLCHQGHLHCSLKGLFTCWIKNQRLVGASCIFLSWDEYCTSPCRVASTWCCCVLLELNKINKTHINSRKDLTLQNWHIPS